MAIALAAVVGVDDDVLHQDDEAAARGGDGEKQVHHAEDLVLVAHHENAAAVRLFEDQAQAALLHRAVRREVAGAGHQVHHQFGESRQILDGRGFNARADRWSLRTVGLHGVCMADL